MPVLASTAYSTARSVTALVRALLNDSANLLSVPVGIVSITRNAGTGVVTVITALPHNMVPGDNTLISGVPTGTSNFNGTFPVQGIAGPLQFTYQQAAALGADNQVSGNVQGYGIGAKYTDSVLMPFVNANFQMLANELENISSQQYIQDNILLVVPAVAVPDPSVQVVINDATAPPNQLPTNIIAPLKIWERPANSSDDFFEMVNLTDGGGLPPQPQGQTLEVWEWRTDGLVFVGATQDTQIRLRALVAPADLVDGTSSLSPMRAMREAIAYPTAVTAGRSRGANIPPEYVQLGEMALEQVLSRATRQMQHRNFRSRSFARRKGYTPF
jgi:hypothetical protein